MSRVLFDNSLAKSGKLTSFLQHRRSIARRKSFAYGQDVAQAQKNGQPIVALESAIITHGMPYPHNLNTAIRAENIVRERGAVPATIGILNGKVYVGVDREQLEALAKSDSTSTLKCSRRDVAAIVSNKLNGGTTVSATMLLAHLAGISIMATGGIGGVHREGQLTLDISTDLTELGRTPVSVVCSGVKSILDIRKTLEHLETQGVPVVKIGDNDWFPAFYCSETHDRVKAPYRVSCASEAADFVRTQKELGINTGVLLVVPVPEKHALHPDEIESAIREALDRAKDMNVSGKDVTPFLLRETNKVTAGRALTANIALVENNAKVAADIARNLCTRNKSAATIDTVALSLPKRYPVIAGGAVFDTILRVEEEEIKADGRTHKGRSVASCGGVGRNVASALIKLGLTGTRFISVVGDDQQGTAIINSLGKAGEYVEKLSTIHTAKYTGIINSEGDCWIGVGEMDDAFAAIGPDLIQRYQSRIENASLLVVDGNLPLNTMRLIIDIASRAGTPVWYEPTDTGKATKVFQCGSQWESALHFISPNQSELLAISKFFHIPQPDDTSPIGLESLKEIAVRLGEHIPVVVTTLGPRGVLVTRKASENDAFYLDEGRLNETCATTTRLYAPPPTNFSTEEARLFNAVGCGDCLSAGIIVGIHRGLNEEACLNFALKAAALSLRSNEPVPSTLSNLSVAIESL